jgi:hypothetical protein
MEGVAQRAVSSVQRGGHFEHHVVKIPTQTLDLRHSALRQQLDA